EESDRRIADRKRLTTRRRSAGTAQADQHPKCARGADRRTLDYVFGKTFGAKKDEQQRETRVAQPSPAVFCLLPDSTKGRQTVLGVLPLRPIKAKTEEMATKTARKNKTPGTTNRPEILTAANLTREPWLLHGWSTRQGGSSSAYGQGSFNLGFTSDDPRGNV